jgi:hypothetical protein
MAMRGRATDDRGPATHRAFACGPPQLSGISDGSRSARSSASHLRAVAAALLMLGMFFLPREAIAGTLEVCRTFDMAAPLMSPLLIPAGSLFRDNGRRDDPLAAFTRDWWQLRLETIADAVISPLRQCGRVLVRVTSDSAVKSVSVTDNRSFVYAGSSRLVDKPEESEELLTVRGAVIDQVP